MQQNATIMQLANIRQYYMKLLQGNKHTYKVVLDTCNDRNLNFTKTFSASMSDIWEGLLRMCLFVICVMFCCGIIVLQELKDRRNYQKVKEEIAKTKIARSV